jgi:hypothetical protein
MIRRIEQSEIPFPKIRPKQPLDKNDEVFVSNENPPKDLAAIIIGFLGQLIYFFVKPKKEKNSDTQ